MPTGCSSTSRAVARAGIGYEAVFVGFIVFDGD
jgi:hypothetical protein